MNRLLGRLSSSAHTRSEADNIAAAPAMAPPKNLRRDTIRVDSENVFDIESSSAAADAESGRIGDRAVTTSHAVLPSSTVTLSLRADLNDKGDLRSDC